MKLYIAYFEKITLVKKYTKLKYKMNIIFSNTENNKISDPRRLLINLSDQINLKRSYKYVALSNVSIDHACKNIKSHAKSINLKYQCQSGMINFKSLVYICFQ